MSLFVRRKIFPIQSYFDDGLAHHALIEQQANEPIAANTREKVKTNGRYVGLHPASETPIAFRAVVGEQGDTSSSVITLAPGQVVRAVENFTAFEWGLPFGWLGGGAAQLLITDADKGAFGWASNAPEILVHRARYRIKADANPGVTPVYSDFNWPTRFPWLNAARGGALISQGSMALLAPTLTRIVMRLRSTLGAATNMRMLWQGCSELDVGADGLTPTFTAFSKHDVVWPSNVGAASTPYPLISIENGPGLTLGGDSAILSLLDVSGTLVNAYVDVCRYGRLG